MPGRMTWPNAVRQESQAVSQKYSTDDTATTE